MARSKVAYLGQIVTVACDLGGQSLNTSCQVANSCICILLPAISESTAVSSVIHRYKLSCTGCLKKAK